jgi:hypothetical protein
VALAATDRLTLGCLAALALVTVLRAAEPLPLLLGLAAIAGGVTVVAAVRGQIVDSSGPFGSEAA